MIKIVLCDDNKVFLESLRSEIRTVLNNRKIDAVIRVYEKVECIPDTILSSFDVFFLDIDFQGQQYTGIDFARKIRNIQQNAIIVFVTNFIEYAPEGYEVQAFRYMLKSEVHPKLEQYLLEAITKLKTEKETIQINISGETVTVLLTDILFIESQGHVAVIHIQKPYSQAEKTYRFYATLSSLEEQLASKGFLRIQKSCLVNMSRLKKYQCTGAILDTGTVLPVSEKNYSEQKKRYLHWKGRR